MSTSTVAVRRAFNRPLTLAQAAVPDPEPGGVVARVALGGVCGTDVHRHHGNLAIPIR
jgi:D-arabinose 1-dehydrogenase-like Zn-dependent alcohol dehydrogenase